MISDRLEDDKRSAGLAGEPLSSFDPAGCAASHPDEVPVDALTALSRCHGESRSIAARTPTSTSFKAALEREPIR